MVYATQKEYCQCCQSKNIKRRANVVIFVERVYNKIFNLGKITPQWVCKDCKDKF